jgi:hypothetical protein
MLGVFALNPLGAQGGTLQMINHGLSTGGLFALVGMIYERYHTRKIADLGGLAKRTPVLAFFFLVMTLSSIGLPGLGGFAGEFTLLLGMFHRAWADAPVAWAGQFRVISVLATLGVVLGAWYMLWLVQRVFFGPLKEPSVHAAGDDHAREPVRDLSFREVSALVPLCVFILWIGLWPDFFLSRLAPKVNAIAQQPAAALVSQTADGGRGTGDGGWRTAEGVGATRWRGEVRDDSATMSGGNAIRLRRHSVSALYGTRDEMTQVRSTGFSRKSATRPPKGGTTNGAFPAACSITAHATHGQSAQRRTRVVCGRETVPRSPSAVPRPPSAVRRPFQASRRKPCRF